MPTQYDAREKTAAICTDCGTAVAAWLRESGEIEPIGSNRCSSCGGASFRMLEE